MDQLDKDGKYRIAETTRFIVENKYQIVTAQFPDELLSEAADISTRIRNACKAEGHSAQIYVLADTTYNSLSVDEVAAAHIDAQCVIHYGRASLTKLSRLPAFFVFPESDLDIAAVASALSTCPACIEATTEAPVVIFLDQPHLHQLPALKTALKSQENIVFADVPTRQLEPVGLMPSNTGCSCTTTQPSSSASEQQPNNDDGTYTAAGYEWHIIPPSNNTSCTFIWIGDASAPALLQLQLMYNTASWFMCLGDSVGSNHQKITQGMLPEVSTILKRRYYLVEKTRNASIVGILVGTLGAAGYRQVLDALTAAARNAGKKTYTLLMGKPNPAKLANFPEIEVFVLVADPQGQILDSKEYLAPIITPQEAMVAFTGAEWDSSCYDMGLDTSLLLAASGVEPNSKAGIEPRFSLLDGSYHHDGDDDDDEEEQPTTTDPSTALAVQAQKALAVTKLSDSDALVLKPASAAEYLLNKRTWTGVEAPFVGAEYKAVEKAVPGRTGRAAGYVDEPPPSSSS